MIFVISQNLQDCDSLSSHLNSRSILLMRTFPIIPIIALLSVISLNGDSSSNSEDLGFAVFRDRCMACHLQSGMGIKEMNAPSIAGLPRWYVTDQLRKFRRDQRGNHIEDAAGSLMQANALALTKNQSHSSAGILSRSLQTRVGTPYRKSPPRTPKCFTKNGAKNATANMAKAIDPIGPHHSRANKIGTSSSR